MRLLDLEALLHLLLGGAVDAHVGDRAFPALQKLVLRLQRGEGAPFERVVLHITDIPLGLSVVAGRAHFDG